VRINVPWLGLEGEWKSDQSQRRVAWSLYVELVTRVAVQPLANDQGTSREALSSLYSIFATTRQVLREAGPDVGAAPNTVGALAIAVLNKGLRPFLSDWHPKLHAWEETRPPGASIREYEKRWPEEAEFRRALGALREDLSEYASALADIIGLKT
jgi:hypothetical protein